VCAVCVRHHHGVCACVSVCLLASVYVSMFVSAGVSVCMHTNQVSKSRPVHVCVCARARSEPPSRVS
jgi:hypothetical protein